jgi:hypothetical protein
VLFSRFERLAVNEAVQDYYHVPRAGWNHSKRRTRAKYVVEKDMEHVVRPPDGLKGARFGLTKAVQAVQIDQLLVTAKPKKMRCEPAADIEDQ